MSCCGNTKKIASKARNIAKGWTALATGKKYEFTDGRIRVCRKCEDNYWMGRLLFCSICKCPIPAKARVKDEKCPKDKWNN
jgi:hypothetical protein